MSMPQQPRFKGRVSYMIMHGGKWVRVKNARVRIWNHVVVTGAKILLIDERTNSYGRFDKVAMKPWQPMVTVGGKEIPDPMAVPALMIRINDYPQSKTFNAPFPFVSEGFTHPLVVPWGAPSSAWF